MSRLCTRGPDQGFHLAVGTTSLNGSRFRGRLQRQVCLKTAVRIHPLANLRQVLQDHCQSRVIFLLLLLLGPDQLALLITRNALPTRLEALPTRIEPGERMGLGIKHYLVKWEEVVGAEEEVEVLQRLGLSKSVSNEVSQKGRVEGFSNLPARNSPCCPDSAVGFWSHR